MQINAAARLNKAQQVRAATAADAGKVVLWIQKALPGVKSKKKGRAGKQEGMEFKIGKGAGQVFISVLLDHDYDPPRLRLEGECSVTDWSAEEKTGRQTILKFKDQLRHTLNAIKDDPGPAGLADVLKNLIKAKSKIETE
jgi:hypothetical protein